MCGVRVAWESRDERESESEREESMTGASVLRFGDDFSSALTANTSEPDLVRRRRRHRESGDCTGRPPRNGNGYQQWVAQRSLAIHNGCWCKSVGAKATSLPSHSAMPMPPSRSGVSNSSSRMHSSIYGSGMAPKPASRPTSNAGGAFKDPGLKVNTTTTGSVDWSAHGSAQSRERGGDARLLPRNSYAMWRGFASVRRGFVSFPRRRAPAHHERGVGLDRLDEALWFRITIPKPRSKARRGART